MIEIPEKIKSFIDISKCRLDETGMSEASVILFEDKVLKVMQENEEAYREVASMKELKGRLPVPEVLCHEVYNGKVYLLMTKLPGLMACDDSYLGNPSELTAVLAEGLKMLWQVNDAGCRYRCDLDKKLQMARYNIENGLVDLENTEPETFGENGFQNPEELLDWLIANRPDEEPVFTHGDYCLPNIFIEDGKISGFIDLGKAGWADKYQDIALCCRSLKHNYDGHYGGKKYEGYDTNLLFKELGIKPDWNKIKYYILLDELF